MVDIDLAKYFDTVNHDILMDMVMVEVKERPIIKLIRAFLKSGVMVNGIESRTEEGRDAARRESLAAVVEHLPDAV